MRDGTAKTAGTVRAAAFALLAACAAGCASWRFSPIRESQFVDEERRYLVVEYGVGSMRETEFTAPSGLKLPFKSDRQVRVTTPDGETFVAYRNMSPTGMLYLTDDRKWEYFEEGAGCILAEMAPDGSGYIMRFQGVICRARNVEKEKKPRIRGSSTPQGRGRPSSGPQDARK